ncbi:expressed unknown protein [Seminavis robusta]|uniref:Uncharacterized protein n=1 Tax=Seminavis robusta TaxID=568900 RepID=A0A9N8DQF3_9STRA|nr:expressed unknown protein [Seminavis robusta]|eukprot:Sro278_g106550.1 n/a (1015) ;mRNA; r:31496-34540
MRTSHREYDPRTNRGLVSSLTKSWKDEQKQLKRGTSTKEPNSSKGKHKSYSGEFTAPPSSEEFKALPEDNGSALRNTPNHHPSDHHVSTSKIVLTRNMRMQAINSAVRKVASEATDSQPQLQQRKSTKKRGMVRSVKNSVRSMFHKSGEDEGGEVAGDGTDRNLQASSDYFGDDSSRRGRSRFTLEQEAEPTEAVHGDTPISSRRRTSRIRSKSEGVVGRKRRRSTEQRQRRGARVSTSPTRGSSMRISTGSDNHHRLSTITKTNRSARIAVGNDKLNKSDQFDVPDHLTSVLANAHAAKEIVSVAKRETMMVQQHSESRLAHTDRSRSTHSSSQRSPSHHVRNLDLSASSLNDFPGVAGLPLSRQDESMHNRSTSLKDVMNASKSNLDKVVRYSTGSIPNGLNYEEQFNSSANSFPQSSPTKARSSRVIDKRSRHSKSRHSSSTRKRNSFRDRDDEMDVSFTFSGDSDVENGSNNKDNKMSSSFRNSVEKDGKSSGAADRLSHSQSRSGSSKMRNSSSRQYQRDEVEMDQSYKRSSRRHERSKMSASDRTHVRTSRLVEEVTHKSMPSASAKEHKTKTRNGSYGALLTEQQPRHVKSVHARSSSKVEPVPEGDDRDHSKRSKSMSRKGSKRHVKSHEKGVTKDTEAKKRSSSLGRRKHKSSRQPKSSNQEERQRRKAKDDQSESESVQWSRVTKALQVKKELEKRLNPNHNNNAAALPELVPMAKGLLEKQSSGEDSNPEASTKLEDCSELANEMQKQLNPTKQLNAALPVDHGMHIVKGLLARATSEPAAPSNTSGEPRSYHPRSSEPVGKEEELLAKSYHGESPGQRSSSLPPKPADVKGRSSSTKKKTRKSSTRDRSSKTSDQKDLKGAKEESRGRRKKQDSQRSSSVTKRSCSVSQRSRQHTSQYKRSSTDESRLSSTTDESRRSRHSSSQHKRSSTDESKPYSRSSTDESQRSRKSGRNASLTSVDDLGFISNHEPVNDCKKKNVRRYGFQEDAMASFTESQSWYEFG